jgi:hypothetical protein
VCQSPLQLVDILPTPRGRIELGHYAMEISRGEGRSYELKARLIVRYKVIAVVDNEVQVPGAGRVKVEHLITSNREENSAQRTSTFRTAK